MSELWLVWMWRHYSLDVTEHDSRDEALSYAEYVQDNGDGSLEAIEGPGGRLTEDEIDEWSDTRRAAEREALASRPASPKSTHFLDIVAPDGKPLTYAGYASLADVEVDAQRFLQTLPPDRVKVRPA